MFSLWSSIRGFALGIWTPRDEGGSRGSMQKERDMDDNQEGEDEGDEAQDEDDDDDDSDEDEDEEDVAVVTIHPSCGVTVDESFVCPLNSVSRFTLAAAQKSATEGCPCCILRCAAVKEIDPEISHSAEIACSHDYIFLPFWIQNQPIVLAWEDDDDKDVKKLPYDEDETVPIYNFYNDQLGGVERVERVVPSNTSSSTTLARAQKWLTNCDSKHECTQDSSSKLPRRVLDVRNNQIKLRETTPADDGTKYACLSHCWGTPSTEILRVSTTPATILSYYQNIPYEALPPTFRDAVSFTRKLGIPFLWIDSFCIIQNEPDKKDWYEQSGNMANVYRNAYVTLAAAISTNPLGGCYTRGDALRLYQTRQPIALVQYSDGTQRNIFARRRLTHSAYSLPLLNRGWVYQERILSPRMIYFVGEEIMWECNQSVDCECGGDDLEDKFERIRISDDGEDRVIGPSSQHPKPLNLWYMLVHDYTSLALTNNADALPAMSGIAKAFASRVEDEYIAGMWRRTLVSNLLWYFQGEEPEEDEEEEDNTERKEEDESKEEQEEEEKKEGKVGVVGPEAQRLTAPSWSWASRARGSKTYFLPVTAEVATAKDIVCQPSGVDPTGELEPGAHFTLTAEAIPASLEPSHNTPHSPYIIRLDQKFTISKAPYSHSWSIWNLGTGYFDLDESYLSKHDGPFSILLAQMASCTERERTWLFEHHEHIWHQQVVRSYMLLARRSPDSDNNDNNDWVRIGLATIAEYEPDKTLYGPAPEKVNSEARAAIVGKMTLEEIQAAVEEDAEHNRAIFRRFDDSERQDLVIW
jgi:hypothetical protein